MQINFEGKVYDWDEDMRVSEDATVFAHTGLHFFPWLNALNEPNHEKFIPALQGLLWLLKRRSGENVDIKTIDFSITGLLKAMQDAVPVNQEESETSDGTPVPNVVPQEPSTLA